MSTGSDRLRDILAAAPVVSGPATPNGAETPGGQPAKRGRGRPKKVRDEARQDGREGEGGERRPRSSDFDGYSWLKANAATLCDARGRVFLNLDFGGFPQWVPVLGDMAKYALGRACRLATGGAMLGPVDAEKALRQIEGDARVHGPFGEPRIRTLADGADVCIDLGGPTFEMARVTPAGWTIGPIGRLPFLRPAGLMALPAPEPEGNLADARALINAETEHDFTLIIAWLITALRPTGPFPFLNVGGEQGSGKSTLVRALRSITDPNDIAIRSQPEEVDDVMVAAYNNHVLAFDNTSRFEEWLSNIFCIIATGGGIVSRKLYSDDQEAGFTGMRPVVNSAITNVLTAPDLAQRAYQVRLKRIERADRASEAAWWGRWNAFAPKFLGLLLDGISAALRRFAEVEAAGHHLPRLADAAVWAIAAEPGLGLEEGAVLRALAANEIRAAAESFEQDAIAMALHALLPDRGATWAGTTGALLDALNTLTPEATKRSLAWPKTAQSLTARLAKIQPVLRSHGIVFDRSRTGEARTLHFKRIEPEVPDFPEVVS